MDISIIGSGYVGLVTGACFADVGHNVICVDNDPRRVETLQADKEIGRASCRERVYACV